MASIYRNAQVTIVAASANSSDEGFLQRRESKESFEIPWHRGGTKRGRPQVSMTEHAQSWVELNNSSRIATRGWTFQERILSSRSLVFGRDQMYWECNAHVKCETNALPVANDDSHWKLRSRSGFSLKHKVDDEEIIEHNLDDTSKGKWKPFSLFDRSVPRKGLVKKAIPRI